MCHMRMYGVDGLLLLSIALPAWLKCDNNTVAQREKPSNSSAIELTCVCVCSRICSYLQVVQGAGQAETFGASEGAPG